ncbi:hypothetical protein [Sphingomonas soli]|uniref:hypothetical protein n=1 Tax=Sphingomonas soli TaxID=266127 RepID=UPI0012ED835A|nr:hypothetical protein [Sphingomonas soli]
MNYRAMMTAAAAVACFSGTQAFAQAQGAPNTNVNLAGGPSSRNSMTDLERRMNLDKMFEDPASAAQAYDSSRLIAQCVVKLSGDKAGALLGGPGTSDPRFSKLSNAMTGRYTSCLRGASAKSLSPALLTSAIAENLVERDTSAVPDRAMTLDTTKAAAFHGDLAGPVTIVNIARCTVTYSPGLARKVLATDAGSPEETAALGALYAGTPECGMATVPTSIGPVFQRSAIADALYAWSQQK